MVIPMLNLPRQQESIRERLYGTVLATMAEARYVSEEGVTPFEEKLAGLCGRRHAVGVGSGTAALQIALLAAGIGPGDEVVTVPNSFYATAEAVVQTGARPVFADVDPQTHLMDLSALETALGARTRAVLPVHLFGNAVDVGAIRELLERQGRADIVILEDCAHAIGSRRSGRPVPLGGFGAFSFNPGKNIGGLSDGGAIVTDDDTVAFKARLLRDHGRAQKNHHAAIGFNSRLSRLNAEVLAVKIDFLESWNERRRQIAARYDEVFAALPGIEPLKVEPAVQSARHQYVIRAELRDALRRHHEAWGIATAVHYPRLIVESSPLRALGGSAQTVPVAARLCSRLVSIPCYAELEEAEIETILVGVCNFCEDIHLPQKRRTAGGRL